MGMVKRMKKKAPAPKHGIFPAIGAIIAAYGAYAFMKRQFPHYMFLKIDYSFFDYGEPVILFFLDYLAIMGTFIFIAYYVIKLIQKFLKRAKKQSA